MKLLPENKLIWSPVVANSRMNRERNASGVNSYEKEFKFSPELFLEDRIKQLGTASWLDLCCGYGKALSQVADYFQKKNLTEKIMLTGVDLVDNFTKPEFAKTGIEFIAQSVTDFEPTRKYDLVTCVHGLHYVGDKLKMIQASVNALNDTGVFVANLDLDNFVISDVDTNAYLKKLFNEKGFVYNSRTKILKRTGGAVIQFDLKYVGADDNVGPNYTGQESVTSHYDR